MSQRKQSKEELFLKNLYKRAYSAGDPEGEMDRYEIGKRTGTNHNGIDNTVQMLAKNGFLKRGEGSAVYLTPRGVHLATQNG